MAMRLRASSESRMPDRRSCFSCGVSSGIGFIGSPSVRFAAQGIAAEAPAAGVGLGQAIEGGAFELLVEALVENGFDRAVARGVEGQRAGASRFQSCGTVLLG